MTRLAGLLGFAGFDELRSIYVGAIRESVDPFSSRAEGLVLRQVAFDADGMDPAAMPAVAGPAPGGVIFHQARKLIHGLVKKGRVVGMDIVEITPRLDVNRITCITAGRLIVNLIGAAVRAGYFDGPSRAA